jgi:hypothetical protein
VLEVGVPQRRWPRPALVEALLLLLLLLLVVVVHCPGLPQLLLLPPALPLLLLLGCQAQMSWA